ncbi:hypothetical protein ACE193_02465 [Bernardetia sp. OM2101]|uniref:hypothetical protein n=1 Tax=Bernardetia sp. OM2101 TaxID=3344876 RepID=UPI0035CFD90E
MKYTILSVLLCVTFSCFGQQCLDVNFKLRGYFYAGSSIEDSTAFGGFYKDENIPKKLDFIKKIFEEDKLQIIVCLDSTTNFTDKISGFKIFVVNKTDSISELVAQDSRLYLKRQVFYKNKWQDIEYIPSSWCGNSYHSVFIKPNQYWEFVAPCVEGKIKATCRFELFINGKIVIYSNEFEGSFNKAQLKKLQGHTSQGLMDSYNN